MGGLKITAALMVLGLSGCAMPPPGGSQAPAQSAAASVPPDDGVAPDFKAEMREVGYKYYGMVTQGEAFTNGQLAECYQAQQTDPNVFLTNINLYRNALRQCLVLDYMAFKDNQRATHDYQTPGNPYEDKEVALQRWEHWWTRLGFTTTDAMFHYMRLGEGWAKPYELSLLNQNHSVPLPHGHLSVD